MRIGLSYDLRSEYVAAGYGEEETAEFDHEDTIEALEKALRNLGHTTERIGNVRQLATRLVRGESWDLVFNIAEGLTGFGREAQVPALLDAYGIPYTFSDPLVLALCLHKGMTKHVIRSVGLPTPDFVVVNSAEEAGCVELPVPLFAKPVAEGSSKGISAASLVRKREDLESVCCDLIRTHRQPVLVETFLPGGELTVGIVGTGDDAKVAGVMEVVLLEAAEPGGYTYRNKVDYEQRVEYRPARGVSATRAEDLALRAWCALGCRDAGRVDLRCDAAGQPYFLEVNPLPGLQPGYSDLVVLCGLRNIDYNELIARLMRSALKRIA